jgi:hypothetical protein
MNRAIQAALVAVVTLFLSSAARAQDIEPRAYSNAPIGVNFLVTGYAGTRGGLSFDPSLPITDPSLRTSSAVVGYARVIELWGQSAKLDVLVPYTWLSGSATFRGEEVERVVNGLNDTALRLNVNLYGAPALKLADFMAYEQDVIVGASLRVIAPTGQYDNTRAVNIGGNRWSFKPEFGVSKAIGPWTFELTAAATIYTDNTDFFGGQRRAQDPVYSAQFHLIRSYPSGIWASLDATWFAGGRTTIDGVRGNDLQQNWRLGGTLAYPLDRNNSLKFYASSGISDRTGNSYDLLGIAWQYRWGGGL